MCRRFPIGLSMWFLFIEASFFHMLWVFDTRKGWFLSEGVAKAPNVLLLIIGGILINAQGNSPRVFSVCTRKSPFKVLLSMLSGGGTQFNS